MKNILSILILSIAFNLAAETVLVQKQVNQNPWYSSVQVSAYGGVEHANFSKPEWGAGLELSKALNKNVNLSLDVFSFETDNWRDQTVDRATLLGQYELFKSANKSVSVYGLGGFGYNFRSDKLLFTAGLGVGVNVYKHLSVFADSRTFAEFNGNPGQSSRFGISLSF